MITKELKETGGAVVALNRSELLALYRALRLAHNYAKNAARRAQRNASTTVVGWALEGADYETLRGEIKVLLERKK